MKAEPMMPKACSMPCICKTFTKASSVVIFIATDPFRSPAVMPDEDMRYVLSWKVSASSSAARRSAGRWPRAICTFMRASGAWIAMRGQHFAVSPDHRHRHANHADEIFLAVERDLFFADLPQLGLQPRPFGNGALGEAAQFQALQQPLAAPRRQQCQIQFADGAAMERHSRAGAEMQPQRPMLGLDAVEIDDLAVEHDADIAGLVHLVRQPPQQSMAARLAHRRAHRAEGKIGQPRTHDQALARRLAREIAGLKPGRRRADRRSPSAARAPR